MAATVTLTHPSINGGVAVRVLCGQVTPSGTKNNQRKPYVNNLSTPVEVQTQSAENLKYVFSRVKFTGEANTLTYAHLLFLYRHKYGGASAVGDQAPCILNVSYGKDGSFTNLVGMDGSTTNIKVVLDSFNFPIDPQSSKGGYMPEGSFTMTETG